MMGYLLPKEITRLKADIAAEGIGKTKADAETMAAEKINRHLAQIGLMDDDTVSISNLQRQILYKESDLNLPKVDCAKKRLQELNSEVSFDIYNAKLEVENADLIIQKYDIIVDGCDNFETRYLINDVCVKHAKPYVFGAISEFSGQVSVFNYKGSATYRDLFPIETVRGKSVKQPNGVLGVLPGIIGSIEANEVIKIITDVGDILSNKLFSINLLTMESNVFEAA
jgi:adenylyltransferase/sulfurtransferase